MVLRERLDLWFKRYVISELDDSNQPATGYGWVKIPLSCYDASAFYGKSSHFKPQV